MLQRGFIIVISSDQYFVYTLFFLCWCGCCNVVHMYKSIICPGYISVMHIHAATEEVIIISCRHCLFVFNWPCRLPLCTCLLLSTRRGRFWKRNQSSSSKARWACPSDACPARVCHVHAALIVASNFPAPFPQSCLIRFKAAQSICIETFKDFPQLGRFMLRDEGKPAHQTTAAQTPTQCEPQ